MANPLDIAKRSYEAYAKSDRDAIEALIADDFHFTSPLDNRIDRATYFERCWPNNEAIVDFEFIHLVSDGDRVFVTYQGCNKDGKHFRNTEILTIRADQLIAVEVYFGWNVPHEAPPGASVSSE